MFSGASAEFLARGYTVWRFPSPLTQRKAALASTCIVATLMSFPLAACQPFTPATQAAPGPYFPVIRTPLPSGSPTPPALAYTVGAWPANSSPAQGAQVTIYVSFRNGGTPVPGGVATVRVHYPGTTQDFSGGRTSGSGYAAINVAGSSSSRPVLVDVYVSYQGQTYTATTSFTPMPGGAFAPQSTPQGD